MHDRNPLIPNLMVENVFETVRYYQDVLGFTLLAAVADMDTGMQADNVVTEIDEERKLDWANMRLNQIELMFQSRTSLEREVPSLKDCPLGASQTLYLRHSNSNSLFENIRKKVEILSEPHDKFYGMREWYMRDLNGYVLCFAEEIPLAEQP